MYVLSFDIVWFCIADAQLELFALKLQAENKTRGICVSKNGNSYLHAILHLFTAHSHQGDCGTRRYTSCACIQLAASWA